MNDDLKTTIIKAAVMLSLVLVEYWAMQSHDESILAKLWYELSKMCYRIARKFGEMGLSFEYRYFQVI